MLKHAHDILPASEPDQALSRRSRRATELPPLPPGVRLEWEPRPGVELRTYNRDGRTIIYKMPSARGARLEDFYITRQFLDRERAERRRDRALAQGGELVGDLFILLHCGRSWALCCPYWPQDGGEVVAGGAPRRRWRSSREVALGFAHQLAAHGRLATWTGRAMASYGWSGGYADRPELPGEGA